MHDLLTQIDIEHAVGDAKGNLYWTESCRNRIGMTTATTDTILYSADPDLGELGGIAVDDANIYVLAGTSLVRFAKP